MTQCHGRSLQWMPAPASAVRPRWNKPPINRIVVDAQGRITLNNEAVTVAQLKAKLQVLQAANPDLAVVVKGADEVDYQGMVAVLDTLQTLAITKVGLATE
jgi:biopolymer transport protein ExbD